ncbi:MAG: D-alanyl-D-alanine carboxypeptidase family protein [Eubacteriales bacterium]|jgi:D-alanyl-D-alanine carboxypeptidase (penicillin-binding protein 5/6)
MKRRLTAFLLAAAMLLFSGQVWAENDEEQQAQTSQTTEETQQTEQTDPGQSGFSVNAKSAILVDVDTGYIMYEQNSQEQVAPASITKVMVLLLAMERIDAGQMKMDDIVTIGPNPPKMTGSRVWLGEGEKISVSDLIKSIIVASGNDAALAMAEYIAGSEAAFVEMMNTRAAELGMEHTHFANAHGLDQEEHYTTAYDIAIMCRELLRHETILEYSTIRKDSLRNGSFDLINTNGLLGEYEGANGLKTGHTDNAGYCLAGSAQRGNMQLLSVVMGTADAEQRDQQSMALLDYGFDNFERLENLGQGETLDPTDIKGGTQSKLPVAVSGTASMIIPKGGQERIKAEVTMEKNLTAPVEKGQVVGQMVYRLDGREIASIDILADADVEKMTFSYAFQKLWKALTMQNVLTLK